MLGDRKNYFIKDGYRIRPEFKHFDDTPFKDEYQDGVYKYARKRYDELGYKCVTDIGCGSGFKLVKYFPEVFTIGLDVEPTVAFCRDKYPQKKWATAPLKSGQVDNFDMAICSDVIEHLVNPDELLQFVSRSGFRRLIISTPERELLNLGTLNGPPRNVHHIREWTKDEFRAYLNCYFQVVNHIVVDKTCQVAEVVI